VGIKNKADEAISKDRPVLSVVWGETVQVPDIYYLRKKKQMTSEDFFQNGDSDIFDDNPDDNITSQQQANNVPQKNNTGPIAKVLPSKRTKKTPSWVWILVGIIAAIIVAVAVIVPLVLLKSPKPPVTVTPLSPTQPNIPVFGNVTADAVTFQLALPALDGLSKGAISITEANYTNSITKVGYILVGDTSKTGYYVTTFSPPSISTPIILDNPSAITTWASSNSDTTIYLSQPAYYSCVSNALTDTVPCQTITWPTVSDIANTNFLVTSWQNVADTVMVSFVTNSNGAYNMTFQTPVKSLNLAQTFPNLSAPLNTSIICMFGTAHQTYLSCGVAENFTNTINYITYTSSTSTNPLQTIKLDASNEALVYASMTYDGSWLIVLTNRRLILYHRTITATTLDFNVADSIYLKINIGVATCAIDQSYDAKDTKIWCSIGSDTNYTITLAIDIAKKSFLLATGRLVPAKFLSNTVGVMTLRYLPDTNSLFLLGSDAFGDYENTLLNLQKY